MMCSYSLIIYFIARKMKKGAMYKPRIEDMEQRQLQKQSQQLCNMKVACPSHEPQRVACELLALF